MNWLEPQRPRLTRPRGNRTCFSTADLGNDCAAVTIKKRIFNVENQPTPPQPQAQWSV